VKSDARKTENGIRNCLNAYQVLKPVSIEERAYTQAVLWFSQIPVNEYEIVKALTVQFTFEDFRSHVFSTVRDLR